MTPSSDERFYRNLGATIRARRESLKLTQQQLGARLNPQMTRASIANIEAGKQRVLARTFVDLANALELKLEDLAKAPRADAFDLIQEVQRASGLEEKKARAVIDKIVAHTRRNRPA